MFEELFQRNDKQDAPFSTMSAMQKTLLRVAALTDNFKIKFEDLQPNHKTLVTVFSSDFNEQSGALQGAGFGKLQLVVNNAYPQGVIYVNAVVDYINDLIKEPKTFAAFDAKFNEAKAWEECDNDDSEEEDEDLEDAA